MIEPKNRKAAISAFVFGAGLIVAAAVLPVCAAFLNQSAQTQAALNRLGRLRARLDERPLLEDELKQATAALAAAPGLVPAQRLPMAQAELQNEIKTLVESESGDIESSQIMAVENKDGFSVIALNYDLTVPAGKLAALAYKIETHQPYLFIGDASVTSPASWESDRPDAPEPMLEVRWTIRAYMGGTGS